MQKRAAALGLAAPGFHGPTNLLCEGRQTQQLQRLLLRACHECPSAMLSLPCHSCRGLQHLQPSASSHLPPHASPLQGARLRRCCGPC
jgi:hypothetical protein